MTISITGQRVVITGGARGIAAAAVNHFVSEGAHVVSIDVDAERGLDVADKANTAGPGSAHFIQADVSNRAEVTAAIDEAAAKLGGLDTVLAIAGIDRGGPAEDVSEAEWDLTLGVNVKGVVFTNQAAFPHLRANGGSIVNFGSDAALTGGVSSPYAASKGAVASFTRAVANEWGRHGIRVNTLIPAIWTEMYEEFRQRMSAEELAGHDAGLAAVIPVGGKLGDPTKDLAPVLEFLSSDASRFVSGQIISVNGGMVHTR